MLRKGWLWHNLLREAALNTFGWRARGSVAVTLAILIGSGQVLYMVTAWQAFASATTDQVEHGRNVIDYTAPDSTRPVEIDRASCEAIAQADSVKGAGALVNLGRSTFLQLGMSVQVFAGSSTLIPALRDENVVIGSALGMPSGKATISAAEYGTLSGVVGSPDEMALGISSAIVIPLSPDVLSIATCTVNLQRYDRGDDSIAAMMTATGPLIAMPRITAPYDLTAAFLARLDRFLPLALGALGGMVTAFQYRLRGSEAAAYRLSGTSRRDLATLFFLEQALTVAVMATSGVLAAFVLRPLVESPESIAAWVLVSALAWLTSFGALTVSVILKDPTQLAKER
jgi:hypothetical protein